MASLTCPCGAVISDFDCPCPHQGVLMTDEDRSRFVEAFCRDVASLFDAIREGKRTRWIRGYFDSEHPQSLSDAELVEDIRDHLASCRETDVLECEACGRLHVAKAPDRNEYRSFVPDAGGYAKQLRRKYR